METKIENWNEQELYVPDDYASGIGLWAHMAHPISSSTFIIVYFQVDLMSPNGQKMTIITTSKWFPTLDKQRKGKWTLGLNSANESS